MISFQLLNDENNNLDWHSCLLSNIWVKSRISTHKRRSLPLATFITKALLGKECKMIFLHILNGLSFLGLSFQNNQFHSTMYAVKRKITIYILIFCNLLVLNQVLFGNWKFDELIFNWGLLIGTILVVNT